MKIKAQICRFVLCGVAPIATGAATWISPPHGSEPQIGVTPGPSVVAPKSRIEMAPPAEGAVAPSGQPTITQQPQSEISPSSQSDVADKSAITVAQWGFSPASASRPVYLSMTLEGTQEAIDRMRADRPLTVEVHWVRENGATQPGAPNLVTALTIGRPDLAAALEGDVRRKGHFEWHSWARKDTLSSGTWTVSLTFPDGQPLLCGQPAQPCRFTINVG